MTRIKDKKLFQVLKADIFNYLAADRVLPGSTGYDIAVKKAIFFLLNTTEGQASNAVVDTVVKESASFAKKANFLWKKITGNREVLFR